MCLLKEISEYNKALAAYNEELTYFKGLSKSWNTTMKKQGKGGIVFLTYLQFYLKLRNMWCSWSIGVLKVERSITANITCPNQNGQGMSHSSDY
jgi:hypothetical protein